MLLCMLCYVMLCCVVLHYISLIVAVCKGKQRNLLCFGSKTIHIIEAIYGRKANNCGLRSRDCEEDVTDIIRNECEGKNFCVAYGRHKEYRDPCFWRSEYLDLTYECICEYHPL